jgi:cell division protease FtsH
MVVNQGMGQKLRDQVFKHDDGMMLDRLFHEREFSDDTAKVIDNEVEELITEGANRARIVIKANMKYLEILKDLLLEKETVDAEEVDKVLKGSKLPPAAAQY